MPRRDGDQPFNGQGKAPVAVEDLVEMIRSLSSEDQESVRQFVEFLKGSSSSSPFVSAVDEFIDQHPELLRRLAQ